MSQLKPKKPLKFQQGNGDKEKRGPQGQKIVANIAIEVYEDMNSRSMWTNNLNLKQVRKILWEHFMILDDMAKINDIKAMQQGGIVKPTGGQINQINKSKIIQ